MTYKQPRSVRAAKRRTTLATVMGCPNCGGECSYQVNTELVARFRYCVHCNTSFQIRYNRRDKNWYRVNVRKGLPDE